MDDVCRQTTVPGLELVEAEDADREAIARLPGLSEASVRLLARDLRSADGCCLIARRRGEVVGYAAALQQLDEAHITDVAVAIGWRRRGIAADLVAQLCRRMVARGVVSLTLEVRADNTPAQALYRRLGFMVEGRRRGYYRDGEDALILWRRGEPRGTEES